jgi:hypothetical protein
MVERILLLGRLLAKAYLRAGLGGLVLCAKIDELESRIEEALDERVLGDG